MPRKKKIAHATRRTATTDIAMPLATATLSSLGPSLRLLIFSCKAISALYRQNDHLVLFSCEIAWFDGELVDWFCTLFTRLFQKLLERFVVVQNGNDYFCLKFDRELLRLGS